MMTEAPGNSFIDVLHGRVENILDACTRCGKCVAACPMVAPAGIDLGVDSEHAPTVIGGILDLLSGGPGTADAERWAQVCTNSGKCIPACNYGINPRFMVNMARIAVKAKLGEDAVRRAGQHYFTEMGRSIRVISRLQLPPEVLAQVSPPLRAADQYEQAPEILFYTGCNVIKTPHIALLVLEVLAHQKSRYLQRRFEAEN
jgi:heterodisulfide reductase subunit D